MSAFVLTFLITLSSGQQDSAEIPQRFESGAQCQQAAELIGGRILDIYPEVVLVNYRCDQGVVL